MQLALAYRTPSSYASSSGTSLLNFAPNLNRAPVFFDGCARDPLLLRDALLNLHDVVTSDFDTRLSAEDLARILDPVCTVASDELFFEAFSQDESSYGRVAVKPELLENIERWETGTTNVDFSNSFAAAIGTMRSGSRAGLKIDPDAFAVRVDNVTTKEKKVKLPPSWLRGFLNVQSSMTGDLASFEMNRADLRNILAFLKSHKESFGPRALVFRLRPDEKVEAVFEPWNHKITLKGSIYHGTQETEVRLFGRRRLALLNRTLPKMRRLTVFLAGSGLPSFWSADLGAANFLLAVSGWTTRPFAASNLFLSENDQKIEVDALATVRNTLRAGEKWGVDALISRVNLPPATVTRALSLLCAQGQAMFDLESRVYRRREVLNVPLDDLSLELDSSRFENARQLVKQGRVAIESETESLLNRTVRGEVKSDNGTYPVAVTLDPQGKIVDGDCNCSWFRYNALRGGPCKHILALRTAANQAGSEVEAREEEWWKVLV
jgi:predicted nucleic acid-binding Zn finger protein